MNQNTTPVEIQNATGSVVSRSLEAWVIVAPVPQVTVKVTAKPDAWGSMMYHCCTRDKYRHIWISDYKDQAFIEIRVEDRSVIPYHRQKFHYVISDIDRITNEMAAFLSLGTVPSLSPAKKLYVDWLNTDEGVERKKAVAEAIKAGPAATEKKTTSAPVKRIVPTPDPATRMVLEDKATEVPSWKDQLSELTRLGQEVRASKKAAA
jgi:hypothetical protein